MSDRRLYSKAPMDEDERAIRTLQRILPRLARQRRRRLQPGRPSEVLAAEAAAARYSSFDGLGDGFLPSEFPSRFDSRRLVLSGKAAADLSASGINLAALPRPPPQPHPPAKPARPHSAGIDVPRKQELPAPQAIPGRTPLQHGDASGGAKHGSPAQPLPAPVPDLDPRRSSAWRAWAEEREAPQQTVSAPVAEFLGGLAQAIGEASRPMRLALVVKRGQGFGPSDWGQVATELAELLALAPAQLAYVDCVELELPAAGPSPFAAAPPTSEPPLRDCVLFDLLPPRRRRAMGDGLSPPATAATLAGLFADTGSPVSMCPVLTALLDTSVVLRQPSPYAPLEVVAAAEAARRVKTEPRKVEPTPAARARAAEHLAAALTSSFEQCVPSAPRWLADAVFHLSSSTAFELDGASAARGTPGRAAASDAADERREVLPPAFWRALAAAGRGRLEHLRLTGFGHSVPPPRFPSPLGALRHLAQLDLTDMQLRALPDGLSGCRSLTAVHAPHNRLTSLPAGLWTLPQLILLDVSHNQIEHLALPTPAHDQLSCGDSGFRPWGDGSSGAALTQGPSASAGAPAAPIDRSRSGGFGSLGAARGGGESSPVQSLNLSHNRLANLPLHLGEALPCLRQLSLESNCLVALPASIVGLQVRELRSFTLEGNSEPRDALLWSAHRAAGTYVAVEMCTAPRPSPTLKGDSARYAAALSELHLAVTLAFGAHLPLVANVAPSETSRAAAAAAAERPPRGRGARPVTAAAGKPPAWNSRAAAQPGPAAGGSAAPSRFPRLGAFEVVVRTSSGLSCTLHSKLRSKTFPMLEQLMGALFYFLGDNRRWSQQSIADGRQQLHEAIAAGDAVALQRYLAAAPYLALDRDARGRSMVQLAELHGRQQCARILRRGGDADADSPLKQRREAEPLPRFAPLQAGVRVEPVSVASSHEQLAGAAGGLDDVGYVKAYSRYGSQPQQNYDRIPATSYSGNAPSPGHGDGGYYIRPASDPVDHRPTDSAGYACGSHDHRDSPSLYDDRPYDAERRYDASRGGDAGRYYAGDGRYEGDCRHGSDLRHPPEPSYESDRRYTTDVRFNADRRCDADRRYDADRQNDAGHRSGADRTYNASLREPPRPSYYHDRAEPGHYGYNAGADHGLERRDHVPARYDARSTLSSDGEGD